MGIKTINISDEKQKIEQTVKELAASKIEQLNEDDRIEIIAQLDDLIEQFRALKK